MRSLIAPAARGFIAYGLSQYDRYLLEENCKSYKSRWKPLGVIPEAMMLQCSRGVSKAIHIHNHETRNTRIDILGATRSESILARIRGILEELDEC